MSYINLIVLVIFSLFLQTTNSQANNIAPIYGAATANAYYNGPPIYHYSSFIPSNAIDDNWQTIWDAGDCASPQNTYWLQVDLQNDYEIYKIILIGEDVLSHFPGLTNDYNLYNSTNGIDWNFIQSGTLTNTYDYVHSINITSNKLMRYAKYEVVGGTGWALLGEIEIYAVPVPSAIFLLGSGLLGLGIAIKGNYRL